MPATCAYRSFEGQPLPKWHPHTGSELGVVAAGISVRDKVLSEDFVHLTVIMSAQSSGLMLRR